MDVVCTCSEYYTCFQSYLSSSHCSYSRNSFSVHFFSWLHFRLSSWLTALWSGGGNNKVTVLSNTHRAKGGVLSFDFALKDARFPSYVVFMARKQHRSSQRVLPEPHCAALLRVITSVCPCVTDSDHRSTAVPPDSDRLPGDVIRTVTSPSRTAAASAAEDGAGEPTGPSARSSRRKQVRARVRVRVKVRAWLRWGAESICVML